MEKGKYVSRSVYQEQVELNKTLKADIKKLILGTNKDFIDTYDKWYNHIKEDLFFKDLLGAFAIKYLREHPEYDINNPKFNPNKLKDEKKNNRTSTDKEI
jgi:hypothetical protein